MKRILLTDADGVLTDGKLTLLPTGERICSYCFRDIIGIYRYPRDEMEFAIVTGEESTQIRTFADKANIRHLASNCKNKLEFAYQLAKDLDVSLKDCIYIGDDLNDIELLQAVGTALVPKDAHISVKQLHCTQILPVSGGQGVIRYVIDNLGVLMQMHEKEETIQADSQEASSLVKAFANAILKSDANGGKVLLCGNGGSAADCGHIAGELVNYLAEDRRPLAAISLAADVSVITSISNDRSYEEVFSRQISALANNVDVLLCISTSGRSMNIISALNLAKEMGMPRLLLTGERCPAETASLSTLCFRATGYDTALIQEQHQKFYHQMCSEIEASLIGN